MTCPNCFTRGNIPVPTVQETGVENLTPTSWSPACPTGSKSLYWLHYPSPHYLLLCEQNYFLSKFQWKLTLAHKYTAAVILQSYTQFTIALFVNNLITAAMHFISIAVHIILISYCCFLKSHTDHLQSAIK